MKSSLLRFFFLLLLVAVFSGGCALTAEQAVLSYQPSASIKRLQGAPAISVAVVVKDRRTIKDKVSCKKNGYGMEMAEITPNPKVVPFIAASVKKVLARKGYSVADRASNAVVVEVAKFYNDFKIGAWSGSADAEIILNVSVMDAAGSVQYSTSIIGHHLEKGIGLASGENAQKALRLAFADAMLKLVRDTGIDRALYSSAGLAR